MATEGVIHYPTAGAIHYAQFPTDTQYGMLDAIKNALVASGWTASGLGSKVILTFTGLPSDGQTVTIDGTVYTFKNTLGAAFQVKIAATGNGCSDNLSAAINAGAGAGTDYGTGTTAHPTCTAASASGACTITTTVVSGAGFLASETLSNASLDAGVSYGQGYRMFMPATPQGLKAACILDVAIGITTAIRIRAASADLSVLSGTSANSGTNGSGCFWLNVSVGRLLEFYGCAHQFFIFLLNDPTIQGTKVAMGVPWIRPYNTPLVVSGATNASPIVIATTAAHGLITGDVVFNAEIGGNTAANGTFQVTVTDPTHFSLDGSTGTGAYTSGGVVGGPSRLSRCIWAWGDTGGSSWSAWRSAVDGASLGNGINYWVCANQYFYAQALSTGNFMGPAMYFPQQARGGGTSYNWGMIPDLTEARIVWGFQGPTLTRPCFGSLWAAFMVAESNVMDRPNTGFDGHNWTNLTNIDTTNNQSIWIAKA